MYGINFGAPPIPEGVKGKFASTKKFDLPRGQYAQLQGVAMTEQERAEMVLIATNGNRRIWCVERKTAGGRWFGIYTY